MLMYPVTVSRYDLFFPLIYVTYILLNIDSFARRCLLLLILYHLVSWQTRFISSACRSSLSSLFNLSFAFMVSLSFAFKYLFSILHYHGLIYIATYTLNSNKTSRIRSRRNKRMLKTNFISLKK